MNLHDWGWSDAREAAFAPHRSAGLEPARVVRADLGLCRLAAASGPCLAGVSGRFRHAAADAAEHPAVGDWVAVERPPGGDRAVIHAVLPRTTRFTRNAAGDAVTAQVVAANVDVVFLVAGLDLDFNPRRIERYLVAAWDSGARPVVVLNKADLCPDVDARVAAIEALAPGVRVHAVSAGRGDGLDALRAHLAPGRTVALLGSSGVGKSTLVNALLGTERQATGAVRQHDHRGRHTTSHRELVPLPGGALLLDTPGMRELQLWSDEGGDAADGLAATFEDVAALAARCHFRDCRHGQEPGCAVRRALEEGTLDEARLDSYRKLEREQEAFAARHDARLRREREARWRTIARANRQRTKASRKR